MPDNLPAVARCDLIQALSLPVTSVDLQVANAVASTTLPTAYWIPKELLDDSLGTYPNFKHDITVTSQFVSHVTTCRPIPFSKRETVLKEVQAMADASIWSLIDKAESAHAMVCVAKKNGSLHITSDLSPINAFVVPDRHPIPFIEGILLQFRDQQVFSKIDLRKSYYHILLSGASSSLTATMTLSGLMAYNRLPMGLHDAASVFQRCVAQTLAKCSNRVTYIDGILVFGATRAEHDPALLSVLNALAAKQFRINAPKCVFGAETVQFLGFIVDKTGIHPSLEKIAAIKEAPHPTTVKKQVMSFLGAVNYLAAFVPSLADLAEPL